MSRKAVTDAASGIEQRRGMIWVELTNGCNLNCGHCYSDSFPGSQRRDRLTHEDYLRIIGEADQARMATLQFIGGEPLLYSRLPELVERAQSRCFEQIEIYSNLTVSRPDVLAAINPRTTSIATSIYSYSSAIHDSITKRVASFERTLANVRAALERRIVVRASFVEMAENAGQYERTAALLQEIGVQSIGHDHVRRFGRALDTQQPDMSHLCGSCAGDTLCVTSEGVVLPCIMSRSWPLGSVATASLADIGGSALAADVRRRIANATSEHGASGGPFRISAGYSCSPDCGPVHCSPQACGPRK